MPSSLVPVASSPITPVSRRVIPLTCPAASRCASSSTAACKPRLMPPSSANPRPSSSLVAKLRQPPPTPLMPNYCACRLPTATSRLPPCLTNWGDAALITPSSKPGQDWRAPSCARNWPMKSSTTSRPACSGQTPARWPRCRRLQTYLLKCSTPSPIPPR